MQYSQKYTLVLFLEPVKIGTEFTMADWPAHITLADVFAININAIVEHELTSLLASQPPISLTAGDNAVLGTSNVILIESSNELQNIHNQIIDLLELRGAKFNTPEFTRTGFLPHSTIQKSGRLYEGDTIKVATASLIDMFPNKNWRQRKVINNFKMTGRNLST